MYDEICKTGYTYETHCYKEFQAGTALFLPASSVWQSR
jgi:hypothetical protein